MASGQLEIEKLIALGERLDLRGPELKQWVEEERVKLKQQKVTEREARAKERNDEILKLETIEKQKIAEREARTRERNDEMLKLQAIEQQKVAEREARARELQLQIELEQAKQANGDKDVKPAVKGVTPKLPPFVQGKDDIDAYLHRFEVYATSQRWDRRTEWGVSLGALLQGDALFEYSILSAEDACNYEKVKKAVLSAYHLTGEGFRQKFRNARPNEGETGTKFAARIKNYFQRWLEIDKVTNYDELFDVVLREQFLRCCPKEHATFLKERKPKTITKMAECTNTYIEAYGGWYPRKGKSDRLSSKTNVKTEVKTELKTPVQGKTEKHDGVNTDSKKRYTCYICGKAGHFARDCRQRQTIAFLSEVIGEIGQKLTSAQCVHEQTAKKVRDDSLITPDPHFDQACQNGFITLACGHQLPVLSAACNNCKTGSMTVLKGKVGSHTVSVLRDTGCSGVVVKSDLVEPSQMTGVVKTCVLIDGTVRRFPVADIHMETPYFTGFVPAMCMKDPVYDLIIGNIPGVHDPEDELPCMKPTDLEVKGNNVGVDQVAVVQTRSRAKCSEKPFKKLKVSSQISDVTPDMLKQKQVSDPSLSKLREAAKTSDEKVSKNGNIHCFKYINGILYREFRSPRIEFGNAFKQVVVPNDYRSIVMKLAHESILGGHLGAKKTLDKITTNFFWPGIQSDVTRYCQSCDMCQRTIPKGRVSKVPIGSVPLVEEPFQRVAVDLVGPIDPRSDRGYKYILVLVDYATRYPEAIPVKNIDTETIAEALLSMFSRLGIPKEILTDQGSQFVSGIMKEVSRLLSIRRLTTTPYHAMCNGLVEKFNGTLKSMLKKMCDERPKDWDRYIDPLLFAYREVPQESTGFAPFELLYGRTVRGPMMILKELWTGESQVSETKHVYQYVLDLQDRLEKTCQLAQDSLKKAAGRYKNYYNKKAKARDFQVGDEVLLLLPTNNQKLLMQWKGPFPIVERVSRMNFKIALANSVKTFHANLLKKYHRRTEITAALSICEVVGTSVLGEELSDEVSTSEIQGFACEELIKFPQLIRKERAGDVHINPKLNSDQVVELKELVVGFDDVMSDIPGRTNIDNHVIKVSDTDPIRTKAYPIPHALRNDVQKEIDSMLQWGIISPSNSPYSCPLVVAPKSDGSIRLCCDMRKINQVTVFDAEPIPDQEEIFAQLSKGKYFSKIDLSKGYWQIPLSEESKPLTAFASPNGLYHFNVMPFGLVNAGASFSRIMRTLLKNLVDVHNFIDDILIHSDSWENHIQSVTKVFQRLRNANLTARPTKCFLAYDEIEFLGHVVGHGLIKPKEDKIRAIMEAEMPNTKSQVRSFLGLIGYYRKFVPNFAAIAAPLTDATKKGQPNVVVWSDSLIHAFNSLKGKLVKFPILHLPDVHKQFILRTDASSIGMGAVLIQEMDGEKFPVAYASKKLNPCQKRYSVMERECLAVIWAVQKFQAYLYGKEFVIQTDHQPLTCLRKSKVANGRIMRWALSLQPFRFRIEVIKGTENVGADYLSRCLVDKD